MKIKKALKKMNHHVIFLSELLLTNFGNLLIPNHRKKITNPIARYVKYPLSDIKRYMIRNFIIQSKRRKENDLESFIERLNVFFDSISQNYKIYYVPRTKRYNHLEILMVKDIQN